MDALFIFNKKYYIIFILNRKRFPMIFIEICLFIFAFYRGRGKEAVISLILFVIAVIGSVELANESSRFVNLADLIFILALGTMGFFSEKRYPSTLSPMQ
jgi:hypothetical protein